MQFLVFEMDEHNQYYFTTYKYELFTGIGLQANQRAPGQTAGNRASKANSYVYSKTNIIYELTHLINDYKFVMNLSIFDIFIPFYNRGSTIPCLYFTTIVEPLAKQFDHNDQLGFIATATGIHS